MVGHSLKWGYYSKGVAFVSLFTQKQYHALLKMFRGYSSSSPRTLPMGERMECQVGVLSY